MCTGMLNAEYANVVVALFDLEIVCQLACSRVLFKFERRNIFSTIKKKVLGHFSLFLFSEDIKRMIDSFDIKRKGNTTPHPIVIWDVSVDNNIWINLSLFELKNFRTLNLCS